MNEYSFLLDNIDSLFIATLALSILYWIANKEAEFFYGRIRSKSLSILKRTRHPSKTELDNIKNLINSKFDSEVEIYKIFEDKMPPIIIRNSFDISGILNEEDVAVENQKLNLEGKPNEPHLLLKEHSDLSIENIKLYVETAKFDVIRSLRKKDIKPSILSAGGVLIDPEKKLLIVHSRSLESDTYPGFYHILGGAVLGKEFEKSSTYDHKISDTVKREINEETESKIENVKLSNVKYRTYSKELKTGFIQFEYLGIVCNIASDLSDFNGNWEGDIQVIKFEEIENSLINLNWVPSGKAHILVWMALGAPGSNYFSYKKARKIFNNVIEKS